MARQIIRGQRAGRRKTIVSKPRGPDGKFTRKQRNRLPYANPSTGSLFTLGYLGGKTTRKYTKSAKWHAAYERRYGKQFSR